MCNNVNQTAIKCVNIKWLHQNKENLRRVYRKQSFPCFATPLTTLTIAPSMC